MGVWRTVDLPRRLLKALLMWLQEVLSAPGLKLVPDIEYSEAGRGVYPDG
jgi:hypothetical protein